MKKLCILGILLPSILLGQTAGKLTGRVMDAQTNEPLTGTNVIIEGTRLGAAADAEGYYLVMNVPPGKYKVEASMMGFKSSIAKEVVVRSGLTTTIDFSLTPAAIVAEKAIEVTARRPIVEQDVTTSVTYTTDEEIRQMPVDDFQDVVNISAGVVGGHFRGGRGGEEVYMIDGMVLREPYSGGFTASIPLLAVKEQAIYTGGFGAEYQAQSGIISVVTPEAGRRTSGTIRYRTDDYSQFPQGMREIGDAYNKQALQERTVYDETYEDSVTFPIYKPNMFHQAEVTLGGPLVGPLSYFGSYEMRTQKGRYHPGEHISLAGDTVRKNDVKNSYLAKLKYDISPQMKLKVGGLWSKRVRHLHGWMWRYALGGLPDRTEEDYQLNASWTHLVSPKLFYEIKVHQYTSKFLDDIDGDGVWLEDSVGIARWLADHPDANSDSSYDSVYYYLHPDSCPFMDSVEFWVDNVKPYNFSYNADESDSLGHLEWRSCYEPGSLYRIRYRNRKMVTNTVEGALTSQISRAHELKTGLTLKYYDLYLMRADLASGGNYYMQKHSDNPLSLAYYMQDKIETKGMVVNAGIRFDYFDPRGWVPDSLGDPTTDPSGGVLKNPQEAEKRWDICPRLGLAHPITDRDVLHFTYGHYFEVPALQYLFANSNHYRYGAFEMIGNANMDAERTIAYEMGIEHGFSSDFKMDVTTFYKDITGLATTQKMFRSAFDWFYLYTNGDYGHSRGIEVTLHKRPGVGDPFSGTLSYTFQLAKGRYSSAYASYHADWAGEHAPSEEHYLDWDQRHTVNFNMGIRLPYRIRANMLTKLGSGLPYTPPSKDPFVVLHNSKRMPYTTSTDLKLDKLVSVGPISGTLFLEIMNIFDKKNLNDISDIDWYTLYEVTDERSYPQFVNTCNSITCKKF
jgi:outer membrane receptor protein involved in Fe transport